MRAVVLSLALAYCSSPGPPPADLVFHGGPIYTQDESLPWAEALAVRGETIVSVGARADVEVLVGESTRIVDLDGRLLLPILDDDALVAIHEAVTGRSLRGTMIARKLERVEDAVGEYTSSSLVVGSPADLTVLQENILKIPAERIAEAKVEMFVVGGNVVYVAATFDQRVSTTLE
ncbi:MAG: hypothetical protein BMS9Abin37_2970 [Acidobacteriota bacterium]|nr:MAG: hypothetical protein BMS9Abin37_2970 [Acidobacteriota bacterium]